MRDSKLASIATRLVETASEIKESVEGAFHMRERLLRETRKKQFCAREAVRTDVLGMAGFGFRQHIERNLASHLVNGAIKGIDFETEAERSSLGSFVHFTAKAYVLTQAELTALVDDAIEIGRRS